MDAKLAIVNGQVWTEHGPLEADVFISGDGRVLRLVERRGRSAAPGDSAPLPGPQDALPTGVERFDAAGKWVLPGAIDAHVHFREPGLTEKEDFASGSMSAALGGVTTVFDMPNTLPPVSDGKRLREKFEAIAGRSYVDYGLFAAATGGDEGGPLLDRVAGAVDAGAIGVKVFLGPTTGDIRSPGWGKLYAMCRELAGKAVFTFHCEDREVIEEAASLKAVLDPRAYTSLLEVRPRFGEILATAGALRLALETGARVHIAHVALCEAVREIETAKGWGARVTAETCPQYLFLSQDDFEVHGALMKVLPPIRSRHDQAALWQGLERGAIDVIATDHAPHLRGAAEDGAAVWEGAFGMGGVQTLLPLMVDAAVRGLCRPEDVVRWTSANPARAYGLYPRKGSLEPGADADIAVVDPRASWRVDEGWWASRSKNTAFWGRTGYGLPVATFVRGRLVASGGRIVGGPSGLPVTQGPSDR